jgi:hypothetical protein
MHSEPSDIDPIAIAEQAVMIALLDNRRDPWTRSELQRSIARRVCDPDDVLDAIGHLHRMGLVNLTGELVTATRAAQRMDELEG